MSKSSKFHVVWTIRFCSNFTGIWYKYLVRNVWRDFRLPISVLAMEARKMFNGKLSAKIDFLIGHFYVYADTDIESLKSLHKLFDKYLDHMLMKFEQNHIVHTIQNFVLLDKNGLQFLTKCWRHFGRRSCDWNNCLMLKIDLETIIIIIFQCSKNYGSPTRVPRLKVAPNMADHISFNENLP